MQTRQHIEKLIRVSQMYYDEGLNQSQIAGEVGYSRSSVSRMLTEARETGIVQITIGHPLQRLQSLEENLRNKYGLKTVRVAYSYDDSIASTLVPQCAAQLLVENLKPDSLIVTSTGTPMAATIRALPPLDYPRAHVTQMLGSLSSANSLTGFSGNLPNDGRTSGMRLLVASCTVDYGIRGSCAGCAFGETDCHDFGFG